MSTTGETTTCIDCGLDITYQDTGYFPWRAIDGTEMCAGHVQGNVRWPHQATPHAALEIFAAFQQRTGTPAAHWRQAPQSQS